MSSKPALQGVKLKQRKGVAKAAAKFEPNVFRDSLIKHLETVPTGDLDAYTKKLDELGSQLDYRKYEQELFQLLLVGRLLAPGGSIIKDGSPPCAFSLISAARKDPVDYTEIKTVVDVFNKLLRRYKYLQRDFEETSLPSVLQHVNKYDQSNDYLDVAGLSIRDGAQTPTAASGAATPTLKPAALPNLEDAAVSSAPPSRPQTPSAIQPANTPNQDKLAAATAFFVAQGLVAPTVLVATRKDHLIKDGSALAFLTVYLKAFLSVEGIDHLWAALRKSGAHDLLEFFPPSRRTAPELAAHFKTHKLEPVTEMYAKQRSAELSRSTLARLKEMISATSNEEIIMYLQAQERTKAIPEADFIGLVWTGIVSVVDVKEATTQEATDALVKELKETAPILEAFALNARSEVALINAIQTWCNDNANVLSAFVKILLTLYNADVLSSDAIIYWHSKGSKAVNRQHFLKAAEPLVSKLNEVDDEE